MSSACTIFLQLHASQKLFPSKKFKKNCNTLFPRMGHTGCSVHYGWSINWYDHFDSLVSLNWSWNKTQHCLNLHKNWLKKHSPWLWTPYSCWGFFALKSPNVKSLGNLGFKQHRFPFSFLINPQTVTVLSPLQKSKNKNRHTRECSQVHYLEEQKNTN